MLLVVLGILVLLVSLRQFTGSLVDEVLQAVDGVEGLGGILHLALIVGQIAVHSKVIDVHACSLLDVHAIDAAGHERLTLAGALVVDAVGIGGLPAQVQGDVVQRDVAHLFRRVAADEASVLARGLDIVEGCQQHPAETDYGG